MKIKQWIFLGIATIGCLGLGSIFTYQITNVQEFKRNFDNKLAVIEEQYSVKINYADLVVESGERGSELRLIKPTLRLKVDERVELECVVNGQLRIQSSAAGDTLSLSLEGISSVELLGVGEKLQLSWAELSASLHAENGSDLRELFLGSEEHALSLLQDIKEAKFQVTRPFLRVTEGNSLMEVSSERLSQHLVKNENSERLSLESHWEAQGLKGMNSGSEEQTNHIFTFIHQAMQKFYSEESCDLSASALFDIDKQQLNEVSQNGFSSVTSPKADLMEILWQLNISNSTSDVSRFTLHAKTSTQGATAMKWGFEGVSKSYIKLIDGILAQWDAFVKEKSSKGVAMREGINTSKPEVLAALLRPIQSMGPLQIKSEGLFSFTLDANLKSKDISFQEASFTIEANTFSIEASLQGSAEATTPLRLLVSLHKHKGIVQGLANWYSGSLTSFAYYFLGGTALPAINDQAVAQLVALMEEVGTVEGEGVRISIQVPQDGSEPSIGNGQPASLFAARLISALLG